MDIITLSEAKALGLKKYFTGIQCKHGHVSQRRVDCARCITCMNLKARSRAKEWAAQNPERYRENQVRWREENREKLKAYHDGYRIKNADRISERLKNKRRSEPEAFRQQYQRKMQKPGARQKVVQQTKKSRSKNPQYYRQADRNYRLKNKERLEQQQKEWREKNPDRAKQIHDAAAHNRRIRSIASGKISADDVKVVRAAQVCAACGDVHPRMEIDHIVALSKGGTNHISNLQLLCQPCNRSKHDKDHAEWLRQR